VFPGPKWAREFLQSLWRRSPIRKSARVLPIGNSSTVAYRPRHTSSCRSGGIDTRRIMLQPFKYLKELQRHSPSLLRLPARLKAQVFSPG